MKRWSLAAGMMCWAVAAVAADPAPYEVRISVPGEGERVESVLARSRAAATDVVEARYPQAQAFSVRELRSPAGREWYTARLSVNGTNIVDTVLSRGSGEARRMLNSRYPQGTIVSLNRLTDTAGQAFYETSVLRQGTPAFKDAVLAGSPSEARKTLQARHPGASLGSLSRLSVDPSGDDRREAARKAADEKRAAEKKAADEKAARIRQAQQEERQAIAEASKAAQSQKTAARKASDAAIRDAQKAGRDGKLTTAEVQKRIRDARKQAADASREADREAQARKLAARKATQKARTK
ncbi:MAG: hypothetical protein GX595_00195 [Lentisphaerae bacterium]|nr:hypothetical protein [Lentisphaerota bacterium]